jgi:small subunit ribosomal protein S17
VSTEAANVVDSKEGHEPGQSGPRKLVGRVVSAKMEKTVVVEVVRFKVHAMYKKYVRVRKRYKAHDEKKEYKVGDRVEIMEHRPLSREKRFKVVRLIARAVQE